MENPMVVCAQCGHMQLPDGSWKESVEQEAGKHPLLSLESLCPSCAGILNGEKTVEPNQITEAFPIGALVQLLGGLETEGEEPRDASQQQ